MAKKLALLLAMALAAAAAAQGQGEIGEVFSGEASVRGMVTLSAQGAEVLSGSQVAAGDGAALLKLKRGGQLLICPRTQLSLSSDAAGKVLAVGLNQGAVELNYPLASGSDLVLTPDLRLQMISPGNFHFVISVGATGDTCLRTLAGDDASVFVAEMTGSDSYQLSPGKSVMFGGGKISEATEAPQSCGCPAPRQQLAARQNGATATLSEAEAAVETQAVEKAAPAQGKAPDRNGAPAPIAPSPAATPERETKAAGALTPAQPANQATGAAQARSIPPPPPDAPPTDAPPTDAPRTDNVAHLAMNSSFVFRGDGAEDDVYLSVSKLSLSTDNSQLALALLPRVSGPPAAQPASKPSPRAARPADEGGGFLHSLGHMLAKIFGH